MVKISRIDKSFSRLKTTTFIESKIQERHDLQEFIWNSPQEFCQELGQDMLIIGKEVQPSSAVDDRIDLLAVGEDGCVVIIELKRGHDKLHLFQAISYAGMVTGQPLDALVKCNGVDQGRTARIDQFLETPQAVEQINHYQRIILVAEDFDYEVLAGAKWLFDEYDVNITCVRVAMAKEEVAGADGPEYLVFTQVFPVPKIEEIAKSRRQRNANGAGVGGDAQPEVRNLATDEILKLADDSQIRPLVDVCRRLGEVWNEERAGSDFLYSQRTPDCWRSLCRVFVSEQKTDAPAGHLDVSVATKNLAEMTGLDEDMIRTTLATRHAQEVAYVKKCIIRLSTPAEAEALVNQLKKWWDLRPQTPA